MNLLEKKINEIYVEERNKLIPVAERAAMKVMRDRYPNRKKTIPRHEIDREFIRQMNRLAVEAGLVDKGILTIMNAKDSSIPAVWTRA